MSNLLAVKPRVEQKKPLSADVLKYYSDFADQRYADALEFAKSIGLDGDPEAVSAAGSFVGAGVRCVEE